jgi:hypothetical protein
MSIYTLTPEEQEIFASLRTFKFDESILEPLITTPLCGPLHPWYGNKHNDETKHTLSLQKLGSLNPNFGGLSETHKQNIGKGLAGYIHSDAARESYSRAQNDSEHRKSQSIKMLEYLSEPENLNKRREQVTLLNKDPLNRQRKSKNMSAKRWCNNGKINIRVEPDKIPEDFVLGRIKVSL